MTWIIFVAGVLAADPAVPSDQPAETVPVGAPAASSAEKTAADAPPPPAAEVAPAVVESRPGYVPPKPHPTVDPLMPQSYRTVRRGEYPCKVKIDVRADGTVKDVTSIACDEEAYYALATAIVQWKFDPALQNGIPIDSSLEYANTFTVQTFLPRKHIVGFVGAALNAGGAGWFGVEGRIHLGEQLSFTGGVDIDKDYYLRDYSETWMPTFRADVAISSKRRHFEHRGIYGFTVGGFGDPLGAVGMYGGFRGEVMTPIPGLSLGGDGGVAFMFTNPTTVPDVGFWERDGINPFYPWLRASVIWYAPLPKDRFIVVPRQDDPTVYEPPIPPPEDPVDTGAAFEGVRSVHWSEIEPSYGDDTPVGPEFADWPPGVYDCDVRALVSESGKTTRVRAESCPNAARAAAEKNVSNWEWPSRPGEGDVQAVFPAPVFIRRSDADIVPAQNVMMLVDGKAQSLPKRSSTPTVFIRQGSPPNWGSTRPTGACYVDVDLDTTGHVTKTRWVSGEIEVSGYVFEALDAWKFFPVIVNGNRTAVRVRLSMCEY